jgi:threonine synthase
VEQTRANGRIDSGAAVVAVMTGTGLKDTTTARSVVETPESVDPETDPQAIVSRYSSGSE